MARRELYDRCAICGWDEASCDVAHIVALRDGGADEIGNVTMLCPNHHRMYDTGRIPVEVVRETRRNVVRAGAVS
jgi:predicted restriction endonuclease